MRHRVNNLLLFMCARFVLFFKRVKQNMDGPPRRVLVVQGAKLGDMVCTTPVFNAIKKVYPQTEVWVVGDGVNRLLLLGHPSVDGYIVAKGLLQTIWKIRKYTFDFGMTTGPNLMSLSLLVFGKVRRIAAPIVVGESITTRTYTKLVQYVLTSKHYMHHYAGLSYLRLLEHIGINESDTTKTLVHTKDAETSVYFWKKENQFERDIPIVACSVGAGHKAKQWHPERFAAVAEYIRDTYGVYIVIIGTQREKKEVEKFFQALKSKHGIINAIDAFSVEELKAFISECSLLVAVDTGPIYIAEAYGIPTVDIVGPVDHREQPPVGDKHAVVYDTTREKPQMFVMNARGYDVDEVRKQLDNITVAMVTDAVDKLNVL